MDSFLNVFYRSNPLNLWQRWHEEQRCISIVLDTAESLCKGFEVKKKKSDLFNEIKKATCETETLKKQKFEKLHLKIKNL